MLRPILDSTNHLLQTPVKQVILMVEPVRTETTVYIQCTVNQTINVIDIQPVDLDIKHSKELT